MSFSMEYESLYSQILQNNAKLFASGTRPDTVVLVVCGREFRAHKAILAAQSPVFDALFKECLQNRVEINDVKPVVFDRLLKFLYSGKVDGIELVAEELLAAADKYQLNGLKFHCEQYLITELAKESAPYLMMLARSYNADRLKIAVLNFVTSPESIRKLVKDKRDQLIAMLGEMNMPRDVAESLLDNLKIMDL